MRGPSHARRPHFLLGGRCTEGREELPCLPRTAVPVRWAVRGEGEAVGRRGSVRSTRGTRSEKQKQKPPVIDSGVTHACHSTYIKARISQHAYHGTHIRARILEHAFHSTDIIARI